MINMENSEFIEMLNELAEKEKKGFIPFSVCTKDTFDSFVVFDDGRECGCVVASANGRTRKAVSYPLIFTANFKKRHHDIVSYYSDVFNDYRIHAIENTDKGFHISLVDEDGNCIVVTDGQWFVVE